MAEKKSFFVWMQSLDRRWIYLVVALAIIIPLLIPYNSDNVTTPPTENVYQMVDSFAGREDRAVLLSFYHDASVMPELYPMQIAIIRHCFERNIKVFFLSFLPTGAPIIDMAINTVKEEYPNIKSGVDYCNFGYIPAALIVPTVIGMGDNIATAVPTDAEGRKTENLPIMKGITNYNEMNLVIEFSGSTAGAYWLIYARPKFGTNIAVGVTAVMAADEYPYLQTGQYIGLLCGLKGAAEYEKLVDVFAAYRTPGEPLQPYIDENGNKIVPGRAFSKDILKQPEIKDLIKITTQTEAKFTPEEFELFLKSCPEKDQPLLQLAKQTVEGNIIIDVSKLDQDQLSPITWDTLNRLTRNTQYKFKVARVGMNAQSVAHIIMIIFIILGNIGYFLQKAQTTKK
ncbi:MAG: hypothetical protein RBR57_03335 [Candidatus Syntrophosphaera sp.]|nr:hypothetical protein [Candidatus Cloacimonadota bacterium]MDY0111936.1 hypothetical protein [Candidatus Syntrophosphaera sp.]